MVRSCPDLPSVDAAHFFLLHFPSQILFLEVEKADDLVPPHDREARHFTSENHSGRTLSPPPRPHISRDHNYEINPLQNPSEFITVLLQLLESFFFINAKRESQVNNELIRKRIINKLEEESSHFATK